MDKLYRDFSRSLGHVDVSGNDDFAAAFGHAEQFAQGFVWFRQKVDYVARDNRVKAVVLKTQGGAFFRLGMCEIPLKNDKNTLKNPLKNDKIYPKIPLKNDKNAV